MTDIPTAEELESLFREGGMERLGMGSRRVCYALPGGKLCVKCYRSEDEIAEGKIQCRKNKPLSRSVISEIRKSRFDDKRNTSCQEYRYWKKLREKLPPEIFEVFPKTMERVLVPSRGWCVVEELIANHDGSAPQSVHKKFLEPPSLMQKEVESAFRILADRLAALKVRLYDPSNFLIQTTVDGFVLRLADMEPADRTLIPVDFLFPFLVAAKVRRRMRRFLEFTKYFRTKDILPRLDQSLYAVRNRAGRLLVAWTDDFILSDPELAAKVIPVPLVTASRYKVEQSDRPWKDFRSSVADNECAWMFYPSKRDEVRTVFFREEDRMFVRKAVGRRAIRFLQSRFVQREIPPLPIYEGSNQADLFHELIRANDCEKVAGEFVRYFEALLNRFPPVAEGLLPAGTFDAIPQNCIVAADGKRYFFDLEYDMKGGVPLMYLIYRSVTATLFKMPPEERLGFDFGRCMKAVADRFGVTVDEHECLRINAAVKRFNSFGALRLLTNLWLSLLPVRSWRLRFCWWSSVPSIKED